MRAHPYLIQPDYSGNRLEPLELAHAVYDEAWLQGILRLYPDILPAGEIEPVYSPLVPIGREVATKAGSIDNLFISHRGYPVLVETKLWRNPEARREVVAQAIDYASSLSQWGYEDLNRVAKAYSRHYENEEQDLITIVERQCGPVEGDQDFFIETVNRNLRLGRFLTMVVGDRIRQSLIDMLSHVQRYPHLATDIALVELACYRTAPISDWPLLVARSIVARTEIVERSVVQVTIQPEMPHLIEVRQEKAVERGEKRKRITLTEEAYWELLKDQAPKSYEGARRLIHYFQQKDEISVQPREKSLAVYLTLPDSGQQISLFFIRTDGIVECWHGTIADQLKKAGLNHELVFSYREELAKVLRKRTKKHSIFDSAQEADFEKFIDAVERFIAVLLSGKSRKPPQSYDE